MLPDEIVLADDSGLEVNALGGAPGVHSARYAADQPHLVENNTDDQANNARLIRELRKIPPEQRSGRFVCVIAAARDGQTLAVFRGEAEGMLAGSSLADRTASATIRSFTFRPFRRPSRN